MLTQGDQDAMASNLPFLSEGGALDGESVYKASVRSGAQSDDGLHWPEGPV